MIRLFVWLRRFRADIGSGGSCVQPAGAAAGTRPRWRRRVYHLAFWYPVAWLMIKAEGSCFGNSFDSFRFVFCPQFFSFLRSLIIPAQGDSAGKLIGKQGIELRTGNIMVPICLSPMPMICFRLSGSGLKQVRDMSQCKVQLSWPLSHAQGHNKRLSLQCVALQFVLVGDGFLPLRSSPRFPEQ